MKLRAPMQLGDDEPKGLPERPERMMPLDGLAKFVPAIEAGARALRREAEACRRRFLPTDMAFRDRDAEALEVLAHHLDIRRRVR